jgi:hypothetical protein
MSYDLNVYLPRTDPPLAEVRRAVEILGLPHGENDKATDWWIRAGTTIHVTLLSTHTDRMAAEGYLWKVHISTNTLGREPAAWSVQWILPYLLLTYLPDAMLEDPHSLYRCTDAGSYFERCNIRFGDLPAVSEQRLVEAGLLGS